MFGGIHDALSRNFGDNCDDDCDDDDARAFVVHETDGSDGSDHPRPDRGGRDFVVGFHVGRFRVFRLGRNLSRGGVSTAPTRRQRPEGSARSVFAPEIRRGEPETRAQNARRPERGTAGSDRRGIKRPRTPERVRLIARRVPVLVVRVLRVREYVHVYGTKGGPQKTMMRAYLLCMNTI